MSLKTILNWILENKITLEEYKERLHWKNIPTDIKKEYIGRISNNIISIIII